MGNFVRYNAWTSEGESALQWYAKAVGEMKSRQASDPTSWWYQAAIHATLNANDSGIDISELTDPTSWWYQNDLNYLPGEPTLDKLKHTNQCQHGSWFFAPWHRMYVYWFEKIVRSIVIELGGPSDWALPYWNYGNPDQARMPTIFTQEKIHDIPELAGKNNPLYEYRRNPHLNQGGSLWDVETDTKMIQHLEHEYLPVWHDDQVSLYGTSFSDGFHPFGGARIFKFKEFNTGGDGALELVPHDVMHSLIGFIPDPNNPKLPDLNHPGIMSIILAAALDPVFWMHHCYIDRIWDRWQKQGGKAPQEDAWLNYSFSFFDENENVQTQKCRDVLDVNALGYSYDDAPSLHVPPLQGTPPLYHQSPPPSTRTVRIVGANSAPLQLQGTGVSTTIDIHEPTFHTDILQATHTGILQATPGEFMKQVYLRLDNITVESLVSPVYVVFIDHPDANNTDQQLQTYAGIFSFFGFFEAQNSTDDTSPHSAHITLNITNQYHQLAQENKLSGQQVHVSLEPVRLGPPTPVTRPGTGSLHAPAPGSTPSVTIGRVSLFTQ